MRRIVASDDEEDAVASPPAVLIPDPDPQKSGGEGGREGAAQSAGRRTSSRLAARSGGSSQAPSTARSRRPTGLRRRSARKGISDEESEFESSSDDEESEFELSGDDYEDVVPRSPVRSLPALLSDSEEEVNSCIAIKGALLSHSQEEEYIAPRNRRSKRRWSSGRRCRETTQEDDDEAVAEDLDDFIAPDDEEVEYFERDAVPRRSSSRRTKSTSAFAIIFGSICLLGGYASKRGPDSEELEAEEEIELLGEERPSRVRAIAIDDEDEEAVSPPGTNAKSPAPRTSGSGTTPAEANGGDLSGSLAQPGVRRRSLVKRRRLGDSDSEEVEAEAGDDYDDAEASSEEEEPGSEEDSVEDDGYSLYWRVDNALQRDKEVIDCSAEKNLRIEDYFERYIEMMARVHTDKEALKVWWQNPRGKEAMRFTTAARKVRRKLNVRCT